MNVWLRRVAHQLDRAGWKSFVKQKVKEVNAVQAVCTPLKRMGYCSLTDIGGLVPTIVFRLD